MKESKGRGSGKWLLGIGILYGLVLVRIVLFKDAPLDNLWAIVGRVPRVASLVPFSGVLDLVMGGANSIVVAKNLLGNVVIFIPLGILAAALLKRPSWKKVAVTGAIVSLGFECIQLALAMGIADVDDLLFNTVGSMLGYGIYTILAAGQASDAVKSRRYISALLVCGILGGMGIFVVEPGLLFPSKAKVTTEQAELVAHLEQVRPWASGKFVKYKDGSLTIELGENDTNDSAIPTEWWIDENTRIVIQNHRMKIRLNRLREEFICYRACDLAEFQQKSGKFNEDNNVLIWSEDGKTVSDLIVIIWEYE